MTRSDVFFEGPVDFFNSTVMSLFASSVWIDNPDEANLAGGFELQGGSPQT